MRLLVIKLKQTNKKSNYASMVQKIFDMRFSGKGQEEKLSSTIAAAAATATADSSFKEE